MVSLNLANMPLFECFFWAEDYGYGIAGLQIVNPCGMPESIRII